MTTINAVLQLAYNNADHHKDHLGVNISLLFGQGLPSYIREPPCFFISRELVHTKESAKARGILRHCKIYKDHYLDYTTRTEYATIEEWVESCNSTVDQIMFGWSRFDGRLTYVPLKKLIDHLSPPSDSEVEEITAFVDKLHVDDLTLKDIIVITRREGLQSYTQYMGVS